MSWRWEGHAPVQGLHFGSARVIFRVEPGAIAGIYREKKADRWGKVKEKIWWWARPKFVEHRVSTVAEAVEAIRAYRPEPIPIEFVRMLEDYK